MGVEVIVWVGVVVGDEVSVGVTVGDNVSVEVGVGDGVSVAVNNSVFVGIAVSDGIAVGDRVSVAVHVGVSMINCVDAVDGEVNTTTVAVGVGDVSIGHNNRTAANNPTNNSTMNTPNNGVIWGIAIKGFLLVDARTPVGNSPSISCRGSITGSALAG